VKGTIQWVSVARGLPAEVRLFDRLFLDGAAGTDQVGEEDAVGALIQRVNPESLIVVEGAVVEPSVAGDPADTRYQFERTGYFWRDPVDGVGERLVFNRIVALKDTWAKRETEEDAQAPAPAEPRRPKPKSAPPSARVARVQDPATAARRTRYTTELGVSDEHAEFLADSPEWAAFFEASLARVTDAAGLASWVVNDLRGFLGDRELVDLPFGGPEMGSLVALVEGGAVTRRAGKDVLARMVEEGGDPAHLIDVMGLTKLTDPDELGEIADSVLAAWPDKVTEYRAGKTALLGLFVGDVMKKTGGAADPETAKAILIERLRG
jgi:glutaminyl-tRNA synthetase